MAEFRKREDIIQEIDILQTWSEMGAPRMGDVSRSIQSLVDAVDPTLDITVTPASPYVPRGPRPPLEEELRAYPEAPSEFADLPPGDDERPPRNGWTRWLAVLILLAAGAAVVLSRTHPFAPAVAPQKTDEPTGEPTGRPLMASPTATRTPMAVAATPTGTPVATPTGTPVATPAATALPGLSATPLAPASAHAPVSAPPSATPIAAKPPAARPHLTVAPRVRSHHAPVVSEYVVQLGDSLSVIALERLGNMDRWPEIEKLNRAKVTDPDLIHPGERLRLPIEEERVLYTVKPGDTLQRIATERLGDASRWSEIQLLDGDRLSSASVLVPGNQLLLPNDASRNGDRPAAAALPAALGAKTFRYVVRHGDSLSLLARRYMGSARRWTELYYLNRHHIANPNWLFPGQVITIPRARRHTGPRYVVRVGDTLWAIAARRLGNPLDWPQLYRANAHQIRDPHWIYPGQVFAIE